MNIHEIIELQRLQGVGSFESENDSEVDLGVALRAEEEKMDGHLQSKRQSRHESNAGVKLTYFGKVRLFFGVIVMLFDNISDLSILFALYHRGYKALLGIGILIDLLPGPITACHMVSRGHGIKSLALLFHPLNIIIQSILTFCHKSEAKSNAHYQILLFVKKVQGLLEAPMQIIFTSALMAHGILPLPWETSLTYTMTSGRVINLSYLPSASIIMSLLVVIGISCLEVVTKFNRDNIQIVISWLIYFSSTILFRLEVWTLLFMYLVEFNIIILIGTLAINFTIFYKLQKKQNMLDMEPLMGSILSVVFPAAYTTNIHMSINCEVEFDKKIHMLLTLMGNCLLISTLWLVFALMDVLGYRPDIIVNREMFVTIVMATTILGTISFLSTLFIKYMEQCSKIWHLKLLTTILAKLFLCAIITTFILQFIFCFRTNQGPYEFTVFNETTAIHAQRFGSFPNTTHYRRFKYCDDGFLGCLIDKDMNKVHVLINKKPSSPLPEAAKGKTIILIKKKSADEYLLKDLLEIGKFLNINN